MLGRLPLQLSWYFEIIVVVAASYVAVITAAVYIISVAVWAVVVVIVAPALRVGSVAVVCW